MDITRKFLQMGYTRSRRYANHKSGRKYAIKLRPGTAQTSGLLGEYYGDRQHEPILCDRTITHQQENESPDRNLESELALTKL
jgi:hypothetical protein